MKLSMNWLADYTDVSDVKIKDYCDAMTMSGSKVEEYEELDSDVSNVVCGRILSIAQHPNAERLVICQPLGHGFAVAFGEGFLSFVKRR